MILCIISFCQVRQNTCRIKHIPQGNIDSRDKLDTALLVTKLEELAEDRSDSNRSSPAHSVHSSRSGSVEPSPREAKGPEEDASNTGSGEPQPDPSLVSSVDVASLGVWGAAFLVWSKLNEDRLRPQQPINRVK